MSADNTEYLLNVAALLATSAMMSEPACGDPACQRAHGVKVLQAAEILLCERTADPVAAMDLAIEAMQRTRATMAMRSQRGAPS